MSSYFTTEAEFPFAEIPSQDLRSMDDSGNYFFSPGGSFDREILTACLPHPEMDSLMLLPCCQAICMAGVSGVGKRTLALSYAGTVMRTLGWKLLYVKGKDLEAEERMQLQKRLQKLFQKAAAQPCVLILETGGLEPVWEGTAACIAALPADLSLTVLLIEDDMSVLKPEWTHDLLLLQIPLPDSTDRETFFSQSANAMMRRTDSFGNKVPTFRELANASEGLTYSELKQVVALIRYQMKLRAIREHHGDPEQIRNAYLSNRFYYDFVTFQEAVQKVRAAREAVKPESNPIILPAGLTVQQQQQNVDPFDFLQTTDSETGTEDEIAEKSVLSRLKIPPNPNA